MQPGGEEVTFQNSRLDLPPTVPSPHSEVALAAVAGTPRSLLSSKDPSIHHVNPPVPTLDLSLERPRTPPSSKLFPNPTSHESHSHAIQSTEKTPLDPQSAPVSTQFNPPQSSRLLAFGARTPNSITAKSQISVDHLATSPLPNGQLRPNGQQTSNLQSIQPGIFQNSGMLQPEPLKSESLRPPPGFSPFEDQSRSSVGFDEPREQNFTQPPDSLRRVSAERPPFTLTSESGVYPDPSSFDPSNGAGYATSKGSRFAKFFDGKAREGQTTMTKAETPVGFVSSSPIPGPRQEQGGFNGGNTDHRAMDDLFAMLNSSAQVSRCRPPNSFSTDTPINRANDSTPLIHQIQHPHLAALRSASPRIICNCFSNSRPITSKRTTYPLMAVLRHCTRVVSTIETSCRMAWSPAFDLRPPLETEKVEGCSLSHWMILYISMRNACLPNSNGDWIKCTLVQSLLYMLNSPVEMWGYRFNNLITVVDHPLPLDRVPCSDYLRVSPILEDDLRTSLLSSSACPCRLRHCIAICTGMARLSSILTTSLQRVIWVTEVLRCVPPLPARTSCKTSSHTIRWQAWDTQITWICAVPIRLNS